MNKNTGIVHELRERFGEGFLAEQPTCDAFPTIWVRREALRGVLARLKLEGGIRYPMLFDLTAIDERARKHREGQPSGDFTVVYHLLSIEGDTDLRVKVPLSGEDMCMPSITGLWPAANWYEREVWDMFGIRFEGHPHLARILMPATWQGHPLRKDHPARATELGPYRMTEASRAVAERALEFRPEEWGLERSGEDSDFMFLNIGPQHPGTHGVIRFILQLEGEQIIDVVPEIGFHHRGAEKMGERQSWHTYIPYTDRVDYLGGVNNNLPYVMAVERLAGIQVPDRAQVIRVLLCELFRISNHLVWYGTFAQDVGQLSPVFYTFNDRERLLEIIEAICGARMHPNWFRIGGVADDLPGGWDRLVLEFLDYLPARLKEYDGMVMKNRVFKARTVGVGKYSASEAIEWGVTGPGLRACGVGWDYRKRRPYSGYERFEFDVPVATHGDCYARALVRIEEMRQSMRIIRQCVEQMPGGPVKADHPLTTPPRKERTMQDIETLITHFLNVSWGPVIPAGETIGVVEGTKGLNGYFLVSDHDSISYRTRIRTPSFPQVQMVPLISRGLMVADLLAILGSVDYVLADIDR
jgi:NADH-quinone oxidoreductase subunit C/D